MLLALRHVPNANSMYVLLTGVAWSTLEMSNQQAQFTR